jgi:hypothetical protein
MTQAAAIVASVSRVAARLADTGDADDLLLSEALDRWFHGQTFDSSVGLGGGWRLQVQQQVRDRALLALVTLHPDLDDQALGRLIAAGTGADVCQDIRPDTTAGGLFWDLRNAGCILSERTWRRLVSAARGQVQAGLAMDAFVRWSKLKSPRCL